MKKHNLIFVPLLVAGLAACQTTNQNTGAVVGGASGALLGATIGKGTGRLVATGVGAVIDTAVGGAVGANMDRKQQVVVQQVPVAAPAPAPAYTGSSECAQYAYNPAAKAACERGIADRNAREQRILEERAYRTGAGQR